MRLEKNLHAEPGGNIVLIMGDWSVPMIYFHEPIKRIGIWWVLRNQGVKIHLIDEYECKDELEAYYYVDDPRTWRRKATSGKNVKFYDLLRCKNVKCMGKVPDLKPESAHGR